MDSGDIKEEIIDELKLEPNDFSCQYVIPIKNKYIVKNDQTSLDFQKPEIAVKSEFNLSDAFVTVIQDGTDYTPKKISNKYNEYHCDICKTSFPLKHNLIKHIKSIHPSINWVKKSYKCFFCNKKFACFSNLFKHIKNYISQETTLSNHRRKHARENSFQCNDCGILFSSKNSLIKHIKFHTGKKLYACNVCQKNFNCKDNLETHAIIHTREKPYACDYCHKMFSHKKSLIEHSREHTGEKLFTCDVCQKAFSQMSNLIKHSRIHNGGKPYACNVCQKTFSHKNILTEHSRIHTGNTTNLESAHRLVLGPVPRSKNISDVDESEDQLNASNSATSSATSDVCKSTNDTNTDSHEIQAKSKYQPSIQRSIIFMSSMGVGGKKKTEITDALLYYFCKDNIPFSTVDGNGFKHFMKVACPLYKIPTRNTIKNKLDLKYSYLSKMFVEKLKNSNCFTLTSDIWTDIQTKSYIGVTIHFLEGTKFISGTLGVQELDKSHTSEHISEALENVLTHWEINHDQVIAIVTDSAANMKKAATDTFGRHKFIPCIAHTINLIANHGIEKCSDLNPLIDKVRSTVRFLKNSVNVNDELRRIQENDGIPEGKILKLVLDVKTRWNSLYYMLERFIHLYRIISSVVLEKPNAPDLITTREMQVLKEVKNLMQPLEDFTKKISGDKYPIISAMLPLINCIVNALTNIQIVTPIGIELKHNILFQLNKRFKDLEIFYDFPLATLLDPRFKNLHFKDPIHCQKGIEILKNKLIQKEKSANVLIDEPNLSDDHNIIAFDKPLDSFDLWSYHTSVATVQVQNKTSPMYQELYDYLGKPVVSIETNPLEVWEVLKSMYPNLYCIAREKLSIVSTSVPSECLFSKAGQTISKARNRLIGKRLSKLVFMSSLSETDWFLTA